MTLNLSPRCLLRACCTLLLCFAATATARAAVFGLFTYTDDGVSISITGYSTNATGAVEIPSTIVAKPVTNIGSHAFGACTSLTSVTIPNSVTSIGDGAFAFCTGLTSVTIGSGVASIGNYAFHSCTGLTSMTLPNSVATIGSGTFYACIGLTSMTVPYSVTTIGSGTFYACTGLGSITVDSLNSNFSGAAGVLFNKDMTTLIQYPGGKAGGYSIPNSVTVIGEQAFAACTGLTIVVIPNNVTSIGSHAFQSCTGLTSMTVPNSVTTIGNGTFYACTGLGTITVDSLNSNFSSAAGVLFNKDMTTLIQYPGGKAGGYSIPNSVTVIGEQAFAVCTGLTSVVIPNNVTSIESYAFDSCTGLTSITIGAAISTLTYNTFINCYKITNLTIAAGVTNISYSGILALLGLTSVTISDSVTSIGVSAFNGFTTLTNITIGNSVTSIGNSAFQSCSALTGVTIGSGVASIGISAFQSCSALTSVTIPNSVTSIGNSAFQSCSALTGVTIGSGVASIGNSAFLTCPNLITIYIKGNAPSLGTTVFTANPKSNVYYLLGTTGWTLTYGGLSTVALGLPTITGQPSSIIANTSENTAFSVIAKTNFPLTLSYQWQRNGLIIPTATAASLYLNDVQSTNVGTYTVVITNDAGSVSCSATLTLTQSTLYTQGQYDSALQTGLSAGFSVGMATGRTQVTDNPNSYGLYRLAQVQSLNVGAPLLSKDQVSGKFKLTIGVKKSSDLLTFIPFPIPTGAAVLNPQGEMEFQFTSPDNAAFYRLEAH